MLTRLARWWLARKDREPAPTVTARMEECERCGIEVGGADLHTIVSLADDDAKLGIDGATAMSADFCKKHCPGGCLRGCAKMAA